MSGRVATGRQASSSDLLALLQEAVGGNSWHHASTPLSLSDLVSGLPSLEALEQASEGRAFSSTSEIRWQRQGDGFTLVWLGEGTPPSRLQALPDEFTCREATHELIGQRGAGTTWHDTRFPRTLSYPEAVGATPRIRVQQYVDPASGRVQYTRWYALGGKAR